MDIPAVSMPIARSLNSTSVALCCDETAHFRVAFYSLQHKMHLCKDHAVLLVSNLHTGSKSDKDITRQSGILPLLEGDYVQ